MARESGTRREAAPRLVSFRGPAFERWLNRRREAGRAHRDEVWDGVYVVSPIADIEHQDIGRRLTNAIEFALANPQAQLLHGTNVSDRAEDWTANFRVPDVAVFLPGNRAEHRKTHWFGGPDFAVEVMSRGDRSLKKLDFYASAGVRELLFVNRRRWLLRLHRRFGTTWELAGSAGVDDGRSLRSEVLNLSFGLVPGADRPRIEVGVNEHERWLA